MHRNRHIKTKSDLKSFKKEVMKSFNGWYAIEIWEFFEYLAKDLRKKAALWQKEHEMLDLKP